MQDSILVLWSMQVFVFVFAFLQLSKSQIGNLKASLWKIAKIATIILFLESPLLCNVSLQLLPSRGSPLFESGLTLWIALRTEYGRGESVPVRSIGLKIPCSLSSDLLEHCPGTVWTNLGLFLWETQVRVTVILFANLRMYEWGRPRQASLQLIHLLTTDT